MASQTTQKEKPFQLSNEPMIVVDGQIEDKAGPMVNASRTFCLQNRYHAKHQGLPLVQKAGNNVILMSRLWLDREIFTAILHLSELTGESWATYISRALRNQMMMDLNNLPMLGQHIRHRIIQESKGLGGLSPLELSETPGRERLGKDDDS